MPESDVEDPIARQMIVALLAAYGNLVALLAASAHGAGAPTALLLETLDHLDSLNSASIEEPRIAKVFSEHVARAKTELMKQRPPSVTDAH